MSGLKDIKVRLEGAVVQEERTENALPLLHEIRHALALLLETGEATVIDLRSLPLGTMDAEQLLQVLGQGEIQAQLDSLGKSLIQETRIPGVWFIEHFNIEERLVGQSIEVTFIPTILKSQPEDVRKGFLRLTAQLEE
ncbi:MAG: hydrogenase expression/formation C-terminal domain-containing protein [Candidatus Competibacteraceae bacterium]|jgi:hydrogenase-1 operon protein HyaF|nr:hydrogenase expression/formation C-terminal domain-containing protein [Candidatus Competibacteraceae bacterium]